MSARNRRIVLAETPQGRLEASHFRMVEDDIPAPGDGEALCRVILLSLDPANRAWMRGRTYRDQVALWQRDFDPEGFWWLEPNDADNNVFAFARAGRGGDPVVVCVMNLAPVAREGYRLGLPRAGRWKEVVNTDAELYGGSNVGNLGGVATEQIAWHNQPQSAAVTLPPLGVLYLVPEA